jgi:hypothetical protein
MSGKHGIDKYMTLNDTFINTHDDVSDNTFVQMLTETQNKLGDDRSVDVNDMQNHMNDNVPDEMSSQAISKDNSQTHIYNTVSQKEQLIADQHDDPGVGLLFDLALTEEQAKDVAVGYFIKSGLLMRKWRPPDVSADMECQVLYQIVVPQSHRHSIISITHEHPLGGHMGVNKTVKRIMQHFYWPMMRKDVVLFCKTCHTCQMIGKPNQSIPVAPLHPIPAFDEPFSRILIDCVGPLPKTKSGNCYLLTMMCVATRFPEAIPLRKINAQSIVKAITKFFTVFGLPKEIQSDQGSNFMSRIFQQVMDQLGIKQYVASAYHPQSQGALERYHQTLKTMIKTYCKESEKDWDEGIHFLLFAARDAVQESLGFTPFELVFGHSVRGPLKVLKETWLNDDSPYNLLEYVSQFRQRLQRAWSVARVNLKSAQTKMKTWYDRKARYRSFQSGDQVLLFLPIQGSALQGRYSGPYTVDRKINEVDYIIHTPDRRKSKRLCHINMLKEYHARPTAMVAPVCVDIHSVTLVSEDSDVASKQTTAHNSVLVDDCSDFYPDVSLTTARLKNSEVLLHLDSKVGHLKPDEQGLLFDVIRDFGSLFSDTPGRTSVVTHDVDVGDSKPIKQWPYRMNPRKLQLAQNEIEYMLEHDIIESSQSEWSSPVVLVPKADGSQRFCIDYRKVNSVTKTDSHPLPRIDDCIDRIGQAKYVSKFDLLKGYWQVPLTDRAREISAFVTPNNLYQCVVMPFGMKNAPSTFQRMMNMLTASLEGCVVYIDDVVIYAETFDEHVHRIRELFQRLSDAGLTVNLAKSELGCAQVTYLGYRVGQGEVRPLSAKVKTIDDFPIPTSKRELMRFLRMSGFYRRFCRNFSDVVLPLTNLLGKKVQFEWTDHCQAAFEELKAILTHSPVLAAPDFDNPFSLTVDASDRAVGAVLLQKDVDGIDHPVGYFSKKLNKHQTNYSTIEKEALALLLALKHFEVYISSGLYPLHVYSDHNPLTFVNRMRNHNRRLIGWYLCLQEYDIVIHHIPGKDNVVADVLSRI